MGMGMGMGGQPWLLGLLVLFRWLETGVCHECLSVAFAEHLIDAEADNCASGMALDLDGDGDVDFLVAEQSDDIVVRSRASGRSFFALLWGRGRSDVRGPRRSGTRTTGPSRLRRTRSSSARGRQNVPRVASRTPFASRDIS